MVDVEGAGLGEVDVVVGGVPGTAAQGAVGVLDGGGDGLLQQNLLTRVAGVTVGVDPVGEIGAFVPGAVLGLSAGV